MKKVDVSIGTLCVGRGVTFVADGIGASVVVCLYSEMDSAGGLGHVMLGNLDAGGEVYGELELLHADVMVGKMVEELEAMGVARERLVAKVVGGAMFYPRVQGRDVKLGAKCLGSVRKALERLEISVAAEHTGGTVGRSVEFDVVSGLLVVKSII